MSDEFRRTEYTEDSGWIYSPNSGWWTLSANVVNGHQGVCYMLPPGIHVANCRVIRPHATSVKIEAYPIQKPKENKSICQRIAEWWNR